MAVRLTTREKLVSLYVQLDELNTQLVRELDAERAVGKRVLKKSKATKYKISVLQRGIRTLEYNVNAKASAFENWLSEKLVYESRLAGLDKDKEDILTSLALIKAKVDNATGLDYKYITSIAMEFSEKNRSLLLVEKEIMDYKRLLDNCLKRKPEQVSRISKEIMLGFSEIDNTLPPSLENLVDYTPINTGANTDVSFLFKESNETLQSEGTSVGVSCEDTPLDTPDDKHD